MKLRMVKKEIKIMGMHCERCAANIENVVDLKGYKVKVDFKAKKAKVEEVDLKKVIKEIKSMGYKTSE